jgi:hypothetical protein
MIWRLACARSGTQRGWRMATVHAPALLAYAERLEKEVERLRGRREEAFREGYQTGRTDGMQDENSEDWRWRGSDARAALNPEVNP